LKADPSHCVQEYEPMHDEVAPKLSWEMEQLGLTPKAEISR